jgi:hypothetical protein
VLENLLSQVTLTAGRDTRHLPFADLEGKLHTKDLYALLKSMGATTGSPVSTFWRSCAPHGYNSSPGCWCMSGYSAKRTWLDEGFVGQHL